MVNLSLFALIALAVIAAVNAGGNPCGPDEVMAPCGKECEDRCNSPRPGYCKGMRCAHSDCRCRDGLMRNPYTNHCVHKGACAYDGCGYGEIKGYCGKVCEGTCQKPFQPTECQGMFCKQQACRCDLQAGFVRNEHTGHCVRKHWC